jgi:hypothetical protein
MQLFSFDRQWLSENLGGLAIGNYTTIKELNQNGDNRYIAFTEGDLQVGDVFCLKRAEGGHTGIVLEVLDAKKGLIKSIEGNTNFTGTREGDKTESLTRTLVYGGSSYGQKVVGFFRRNFTKAELEKLNYDEKTQTFVFTNKSYVVDTDNPKFKAMATKLFDAMDGYGTDFDMIKVVFNQLSNQSDFDSVFRAFGIRTISSGKGNVFVTDFKGNLSGALYNELSSGEINELNSILRNKGIRKI